MNDIVDGRSDEPGTPRVHMIGNAHIDPVWLWRWPEGCAEAIGTCWAAVDLLDTHPGFIFTRGEALMYQWIEDLEPVLFARIGRFVAEGRWVIVNGWWIQPDCNLPDGEAFIRQALYGKRYFRERFGVNVTVGYNVDSFGHTGTLPMLLRHTRSDTYVFMRPNAREKSLPASLFDWLAPDGSRVTAYRLLEYYNHVPPLAEKIAMVETLAAREGYPLMSFFGVGNHGGGPTRADLALIAQARARGHDLVFGDPQGYFAEVATVPRPEVHGELQMHAIGCYSVVAPIKALNRRVEGRLALAEAARALAAHHATAPYPAARLRALWQTVLFNQFHDILCGTSVPSATRDAIEALGGVAQGAEDVLNTSLRRLAATITPASDRTAATFVVFNLTGLPRRAPLEHEPWLDRPMDEPYRLLDDEDVETTYQTGRAEAFVSWMRRIVFVADVPAYGYRVYRFARGVAAAAPSTLTATRDSLESSAWRLEIDRRTGGIARLLDKQVARDVFDGTAHFPIVVDDHSDTWAHGLDHFGRDGEEFVCEGVDVVEAGPLRAALRVRARAGRSTMTTTYMLHDDPALPLEIRVRVEWREQRRLLRLRYPVAADAPTFRYEIPAGSATRPPDGREYPGQRWALISGRDGYKVVVVSDAFYSYAADGQALYVTALRSPVYAHHDPYALEAEAEYPYTDQGEHLVTLRLLAGQSIGVRDAHALADGLTRPLIVTPHVSRSGSRPCRGAFLAVDSGSSVSVWLKEAEDGAGLIVRVLEVEGRPDSVVFGATGERYTVPPSGLLTLRQGQDGRWHQSDGLESDQTRDNGR